MSEPTPGQYLAAGAIVATHGPPETRQKLAEVLFDAPTEPRKERHPMPKPNRKQAAKKTKADRIAAQMEALHQARERVAELRRKYAHHPHKED